MPLQMNIPALERFLAEAFPQIEALGFSITELDERRLVWIWTHRLIDWVRLRAWTWLP